MRGRELSDADGVDDWTSAARAIAELEAGELPHTDAWLAMGVRDRRPAAWAASVEGLFASPIVQGLEPEVLQPFERLLPSFIARYCDAFAAPATLIHQDSGCCNIHLTPSGPVLFDWADVVVGHPIFSCDRLLDQALPEHREAIIAAFLEPLAIPRAEFQAMRRSNVLHEVMRYHDELAYMPADSPTHINLANNVRAQIRVLVAHELKQRP